MTQILSIQKRQADNKSALTQATSICKGESIWIKLKPGSWKELYKIKTNAYYGQSIDGTNITELFLR